jgi:K+-transporting ATPase ATPase C chain
MFAHLRANLALTVATILICAVAYPALLLGIGQVVFPGSANGSLVAGPDGKPVGSRLIAQPFAADEDFWPRPSAASYNAAAAGGSNWGPNNPKLRDRAAQLLGPLVRYRKDGPRKGAPVGPDIEAWFAAAPDRAATWAADNPTPAGNWAKADMSGDEYGPNGKAVQKWIADTKKDAGTKPEDAVAEFFADWVKAHPGTFPGQVEVPAAGGKTEKQVKPVKEGTVIQALFFDTWLRDPANREKAADIEKVPADFVSASGSGLDPHITLRNARWQFDRVAAAWAKKTGTDESAVRKQIDEVLTSNSGSPLFGLAGEPLVNVLEVNLALRAKFGGEK